MEKLNSKQRANLRSIAQTLKPLFNVGKGGINDNMVADIFTALESHELVKINVLKSCEVSAKEIVDGLAAATKSEPVQVIGNRIVLYRYSTKDGVKHLEFASKSTD